MAEANRDPFAGWLTVTEFAKAKGYTADHIRRRCEEDRITGAVKRGNMWWIPEDAEIVYEWTEGQAGRPPGPGKRFSLRRPRSEQESANQ